MTTRRSFLTTLIALPLASSFIGATCTPSAVIQTAQNGIMDAELVLSIIQTAVDGYFATKPNAALQTKIDDAMTDTQQALRVCSNALAVATSINDANYQAAIASFQAAFTALTQLIATIGIQVAPIPASVGVPGARSWHKADGVLVIAPPVILQQLKVKTSYFSCPPSYVGKIPQRVDISIRG